MELTGSVADLAAYFDSKLKNLKQTIEIHQCLDSYPDAWHALVSLSTEVDELETFYERLRAKVEERKNSMKSFKVIKDQLSNLDCQIEKHLKHVSVLGSGTVLSTNSISNVVAAKSSTPMYRSSNGRVVESPVGESDEEGVDGKMTPVLTCSEIRKMSSTLFFPTIEHLSSSEFEEDVSKYMKGRLTLQQVNCTADELNKALSSKYSLMRTAKAQRTEPVQRAIRAYQNQEIPESKGLHFIVEADIVNMSNLKLDKTTRNILVILRHCGRLRELRGGGLVRYVVA